MKKTLLGLTLVLAACGGAPAAGGSTAPTNEGAGGDIGTVSLKNTSSFDIYSIQLTPYDEVSWGQNLVAGDALMHGETTKVSVFDCKKYDLRMVDDENVECIIQDIDLCFEDKEWSIDDATLSVCAAGWAD